MMRMKMSLPEDCALVYIASTRTCYHKQQQQQRDVGGGEGEAEAATTTQSVCLLWSTSSSSTSSSSRPMHETTFFTPPSSHSLWKLVSLEDCHVVKQNEEEAVEEASENNNSKNGFSPNTDTDTDIDTDTAMAATTATRSGAGETIVVRNDPAPAASGGDSLRTVFYKILSHSDPPLPVTVYASGDIVFDLTTPLAATTAATSDNADDNVGEDQAESSTRGWKFSLPRQSSTSGPIPRLFATHPSLSACILWQKTSLDWSCVGDYGNSPEIHFDASSSLCSVSCRAGVIPPLSSINKPTSHTIARRAPCDGCSACVIADSWTTLVGLFNTLASGSVICLNTPTITRTGTTQGIISAKNFTLKGVYPSSRTTIVGAAASTFTSSSFFIASGRLSFFSVDFANITCSAPGCALGASNSNVDLTDSYIFKVKASTSVLGSVVYAFFSTNLTLTNVIIEGSVNPQSTAQGILYLSTSRVFIKSSLFTNNFVGAEGGVFYCTASTLVSTDSYFIGNVANGTSRTGSAIHYEGGTVSGSSPGFNNLVIVTTEFRNNALPYATADSAVIFTRVATTPSYTVGLLSLTIQPSSNPGSPNILTATSNTSIVYIHMYNVCGFSPFTSGVPFVQVYNSSYNAFNGAASFCGLCGNFLPNNAYCYILPTVNCSTLVSTEKDCGCALFGGFRNLQTGQCTSATSCPNTTPFGNQVTATCVDLDSCPASAPFGSPTNNLCLDAAGCAATLYPYTNTTSKMCSICPDSCTYCVVLTSWVYLQGLVSSSPNNTVICIASSIILPNTLSSISLTSINLTFMSAPNTEASFIGTSTMLPNRLFLATQANVTFTNITFSSFQCASSGCALSASSSRLVFNDCTFKNIAMYSTASLSGAALSFLTNFDAVINRCSFINNSNSCTGLGSLGGAVYATATPLAIINSTFLQNRAQGEAGVMYHLNSKLIITDSRIEGNSCEGAGCLMSAVGIGGSLADETAAIVRTSFISNVCANGSDPLCAVIYVNKVLNTNFLTVALGSIVGNRNPNSRALVTIKGSSSSTTLYQFNTCGYSILVNPSSTTYTSVNSNDRSVSGFNNFCTYCNNVFSDATYCNLFPLINCTALTSTEPLVNCAAFASSTSVAYAASQASAASATAATLASVATISAASASSAAVTASASAASVATVASVASAATAASVATAASAASAASGASAATAASAASAAATLSPSSTAPGSTRAASSTKSPSAAPTTTGTATPLANGSTGGDSMLVIAIAAAVAAVLVVALIAGVLVFRRKRKATRFASHETLRETIPMQTVPSLRSVDSDQDLYSAVSGRGKTQASSSARDGVYATPSANASLYADPNDRSSYVPSTYIVPPYAISEYARSVISQPSIRHALQFPQPPGTVPFIFPRAGFPNTRFTVLGEGQFGQIKKAVLDVRAVPKHCQDLVQLSTQGGFFVCAVKELKVLQSGSSSLASPEAIRKAEQDFLVEGKMMSNFNHENVVRVIALLAEESPLMLVIEFVPYGDLKKLLLKSRAADLAWNLGELLHVSRQIASGMAYLESIKFIHRDLAARNILVHRNLTAKISDFGLSKELSEEKDYYRLQTKGKLPVKWMAPESLGHRRFTHASDVWSFGVVLWEIFSYADQVYDQVDSRDLLTHLERGNRLACPPACMASPEVYQHMLQCWEWEAEDRPSFKECESFFRARVQALMSSGQLGERRDLGAILNGEGAKGNHDYADY